MIFTTVGLFRALGRAMTDDRAKALLFLTAIVIAAGTVFYMAFEHWGAIDAFYFVIMTLATVGYGDFAPTTQLTRLVTAGYVLLGVGLFASLVATLAAAAVVHREEKIRERTGGAQIPPVS